MKTRILIVGDFNREDFQYPATLVNDVAEVYFLEYLNESQIKNQDYKQFAKVLFWKDYPDAFDLLKKIKPSKIIFYFIESYNHVALNVAAKLNNIPTYHLEHGLRCYKRHRALKASHNRIINTVLQSPANRLKSFFAKNKGLIDRYKTRRFFFKTIAKSPDKEKQFLKHYYNIRSTNSIFDTFEKITDEYRLPDKYISFSPLVFKYHQVHESLHPGFPVECIGVPNFDIFYPFQNIQPSGNNVLFIDQPFLEQHRYGWTTQIKQDTLISLCVLVKKHNRHLYIKAHPLSRRDVFNVVEKEEHITILKAESWSQIIPDICTVLGFHSTLMIPFIAIKHICCISMNIHPDIDAAILPSMLESNAITKVNSLEELEKCFENLDTVLSKQVEYKDEFIEQWLYKFDGKSSDRLKRILLKEETIT